MPIAREAPHDRHGPFSAPRHQPAADPDLHVHAAVVHLDPRVAIPRARERQQAKHPFTVAFPGTWESAFPAARPRGRP